MMLDIDFFKDINDTYGHLVGDEVLKQLAERLRNNMRFYDIPFRYGGEEFVVILNDTDNQEAKTVGDRLCKTIASTPFVLESNLKLSISVSIGIACLWASDKISGYELIDRADQNLLRAKTLGRNRIEV